MSDTEGFTIVEEMAAIAEPAAVEKDETYYWVDNVKFSVEGVLFRVSPYPFVLGSKSFVEKYGLLADKDEGGPENIVQLEGVTTAQFRVFLKFMFPVHLTSTTSTFTKAEWLTILTLSVQWHFHEARKLAIEHLDSLLTDVELILTGRAAHVPRWVVQGYKALIDRPLNETITEEEADDIGHREVNRLWAIRCHQLAFMPPNPGYIARAISSKFSEELVQLATQEKEYRTIAEIDEERLEEERKKHEEEIERELWERDLERARIEEEEEFQRLEDEEAQRLWLEEEARKSREEAEYHASVLREARRVADEKERDATAHENEGQGVWVHDIKRKGKEEPEHERGDGGKLMKGARVVGARDD